MKINTKKIKGMLAVSILGLFALFLIAMLLMPFFIMPWKDLLVVLGCCGFFVSIYWAGRYLEDNDDWMENDD